jgi:tripartite-type tricarboxylate transporter receptor subunit TctC
MVGIQSVRSFSISALVSAGGGTDTYARILASVIPEFINNQPMVILNKPGGAQVPAMKFVQNAKPDGYTLHFISAGSGVVATELRDRGVNWMNDFVPIAQVGLITMTLMTQADSKFKTPQDVIASIKEAHAAGNKLRWGHPGRGSITQLATLAWLTKHGVDGMVQDVPFKGSAKTRAAIIGKQIDMGALAISNVTGFEDKLHVVGQFGEGRDPALTEYKNMGELGSEYVPMYSPMMLTGPKGMPAERIAFLAEAIKKATEHPAFKSLTKKAGLGVIYRGSAETKALMEKLRTDWMPTIEQVKAAQAAK